ncbi:MAG: four helix bundle protein [Candidatus Peribacteraceae bacterium]|jgi:four helix bundle protein
MVTFHSFEDMDVWQKSRTLIREIRSVCKRDAVQRDFAFVDQITRASRSISANIAEGFEAMTNPEFIQFLGYAKRSAGEVRSHLHDAIDERYISEDEFRNLDLQAVDISKMLACLIRYLQRTKISGKRTCEQTCN